MEALPIFLDDLVAPWLAVLISVTFVLVFGEILPQAIFTADPISAGYKMKYLVIFFKWILWPICKPISMLLDCCIGDHQQAILFSPDEMDVIIENIELHKDQKTMIQKLKSLNESNVQEAMQPWNEVHAVNSETILNAQGMYIYNI